MIVINKYLITARFLLVTQTDGVVGSYTDIEEAKQKMKPLYGTFGRSRLIAEVNPISGLIRDPHLVGGQRQVKEEGFNQWWNNWDPDIHNLMDVAAEFLKSEHLVDKPPLKVWGYDQSKGHF